MFNQVTLIGNLTRTPELKYTPSGTAVCKFGVATNRKYGEDKQETFFGEVTAWGKLAENVAKFMAKGSKVLVVGRLITETWEKDGEKKSKTAIAAENIRFMDTKKAAEGHEDNGHEEVSSGPGGLEPF